MDIDALHKLLRAAAKAAASDVHLMAGLRPAIRVNGVMRDINLPPIGEEEMAAIAEHLLGKPAETIQDEDAGFELADIGRFRVNAFSSRGRLGAVLRLVPADPPSLEDLGLPDFVSKIADLERGLVLVTGITGSGKSTTLAAIIDAINHRHKKHVVTIEDPIEFVHDSHRSRITQREVHSDTPSFAHALRAALRQDPDVILVGEMRDVETIDTAVKAAETGHLVLSTVHTADASTTIGRILDAFPLIAQDSMRIRLAETLKATLSQRLLPRPDSKGLVLAMEILVVTRMVQELIRDKRRTIEILDYIEKGRDQYGSQSFDQNLADLYRAGTLSYEVAQQAASNPSDFERTFTLER